METTSLWESLSHPTFQYPELTGEVEVDVVIVGGGITGVTAASHLIKAGKKVAIVEANKIGCGTTGFSTGNLYISVQPFYQNLVKKFDEPTAKIIAHSRKAAIDFIEHTVAEKQIACQFTRRPWYILTALQDKLSFLETEVNLLKKMDIAINYTESVPLSFKFKKAAVMENQARLNPLKYVAGFAAALSKQGCMIFENSRVMEFSEKDDCIIKTTQGQITAKKMIIATHTPIGINLSQVFTAPYRSYVVASHLKSNSYPEGHFLDLDTNEYYASCTHPETALHPELILTAGSHHKTGQAHDAVSHFKNIENYMHKNFDISETVYRWSAQHYHSADSVPYIGLSSRLAKHSYMATGFFADGLIYGTIAAKILSDLVLGYENNLAETYNANRFKPIASSPFLVKENSNVFAQYLKDFPLTGDAAYENIKVGEGKVVEINSEKCGVSRDSNNAIHIVSAVCTHMKCIVDWNNAEQSWDCPCHGSRFSAEGKVLEGPAQIDLELKS